MRSMKYPHIHIAVADGAPIATILDRIDRACAKHGVPTKDRQRFKIDFPSRGYANQIDFIRDWFETD